jgi:hypothetical protein
LSDFGKSAASFPAFAQKFGYSVKRGAIFTSIREFYPDAAAHFIRKHREKMAAKAAAQDAGAVTMNQLPANQMGIDRAGDCEGQSTGRGFQRVVSGRAESDSLIGVVC